MPIVIESVEPDNLYDQHHEYGCGNHLSESACNGASKCTWFTNPEYNYLAYGMREYIADLNANPYTCSGADRPCYNGYNATKFTGVGESPTRPSTMTDAEKETSVFHITYNDGTSNWCQYNPDPKSIKFHHSTRSNDSNAVKILNETGEMVGFVPKQFNEAILKKFEKISKKYTLKVKGIHKWDGPTGLEVEFSK